MFANRFIHELPNQLSINDENQNRGEIALNAAPVWLRSLLDDVGFGVLILDRQLNVCFINKDAKVTLGAIGIVDVAIGSTVTANSREKPGNPCNSKFVINAKIAATGQRKLVIFGDRENQIAVAMSPIKLDGQYTDFGVIVNMERKSVCETISLWAYGKVQGLTPGELKVLQQLTDGQDPTAVAKTLKISVTTVRTHIRSMVNKTDSSCMRGLLMKVAKLPPIRTLSGHFQE
jgi:Bacterial regulatory proteins, luxR family